MNYKQTTIHIPARAHETQSVVLQDLVPMHDDAQAITLIVEPGAQVIMHDLLGKIKASHVTTVSNITRVLKIIVQNGATCTYLYHQNCSQQIAVADELHIHAHENAQVRVHILITGAHQSQLTCNLYADGQHANIVVAGAYIVKNEQRVTINSVQQHNAPNSSSHLAINGIVADCAQATYRGMVHIEKEATGVDASQENKNILLDETAQVQSVPSLQALNNEVQCAHGSAIGYLDAQQIFYLQARGLSAHDAQRLLLQSFIALGNAALNVHAAQSIDALVRYRR